MTVVALPGRRLRPGVRGHGTFEPLQIASERCKGCGLCVAVCPKHILALDESIVSGLGYHPVRLIDAAACTSCALCARICPDAVFAVYAPPRAT
jgi:Indolepyruvate ferredoxin oxidoreductase, alpha and beta subunits